MTIFRAGSVFPLFVLVSLLTVPAWGKDTAVPPVVSITFAGKDISPFGEELELHLAGNGEALIDWGDGARETVALREGDFVPGCLYADYAFTHRYSGRTGEVTVTIEGAVTFLSCANTHAVSLDTSGNPALRQLWCYNSDITSLDISGNPALWELLCGDSGITSLDLSGNPALSWLDCADTGITSLDLSSNLVLETLYCYKVGISSLDLRAASVLRHLSCNDSGITSLDLRNNTALEVLNCANTRITALKLHTNPALEVLHCANTRITSLDLRSNAALERLNCSGTRLVSLELPGSTDLEWIRCNDTRMDAAAALAVFVSLPDNTNDFFGTKEIYCGGTTACGEEAHAIADLSNWEVHHKQAVD